MKPVVLTIYFPTLAILSIAAMLPCASAAVVDWSALPAVATPTEEDFDSAFRSRSIPWFDSKASEIKSPKPPKQARSSVEDRNRIPPKIKNKKGQAIVKPKKVTGPVGGGTAGTAGAASFGTSVIYVAGVVLVVALIGVLLYGFMKLESDGKDLSRENSKRKRKIKDHIMHLPFDLEEQEGDFESFAEQAFREGNYSNAVIYLFADLLVAMNEAGVLRLQRGKTNRQYLNEIWDYEAIRPYYRSVMTAFEDAFFGQHEISKSRAEDCFTARPDFDAAVETIRQQKFNASANEPALTTSSIQIEGAL